MTFGFVLPKGDARTAAEDAHQVEQSGQDGFFRLGASVGYRCLN